ncbi:dynamin family protein [Clostridium uliginosum]|uniref:Dynamin family protein n=1 Tax=Clostridium uliginosum TaxID=119641 RepID=A0A1I1Q5T6_9CLOT|nr:dynamin family protein [Clostridium uliginosum]SFD17395.1 Dynamin family protein [Clostridium uliginosum]
MNNFESCINRQDRIDMVVNALGNDGITNKNLFVKERIMNPSHYVVMLGETSSGKSALINSIFDKKILVESVRPTTGVVTEVVISHDSGESLIGINKDATFKNLDKDTFDKLTVKPDEGLHRLRYTGSCKDSKYAGMRLFDTPGYGSLISYHEEVLKEFIPESDFIVYVVSYRVGLGDDDYQFLKYVGEIKGENVEVILAINMCPQDVQDDNKRIREIRESVNECIHKDVKTFFIESNSEKKPNTTKLWDYIHERVNDDKKKEELLETLKNYQDYILEECKIKVNSKIANDESKQENIEERLNITREFLDKKKEILETLDIGFTKVKLKSLKFIDKSDITIKDEITKYIYDESKWSMKEETFTLMQHYYVPKLTNEETENLMTYLEDEIICLDRTIGDMLNTAIANLEKKVKINIPSYTEVMEGVVQKHVGDVIKQATGEMFRKAHKRGYIGTKNVTSEKLGNIFGDTASKQTNNNLKHLLKVIKATSLKGITEYLSVFTDSIFFLYDSLTWQKKINEISLEAIDNWANDVERTIRKYLDELKETNKEEIISLFDELSEEFKETEKELEDISLDELDRLRKEIEFILHKCLYMNLKK